jgi:CheY-like chemotaxis protein
MKILVIEDDYPYFAELKNDLEHDREISREGLEIVSIESERQFRESFEDIARAGFDFAIVDVMVKWEGREPDHKRPPKEVLEDGYYSAGFRCLQMLRDDPRTKALRVILHSNLDEPHMGELRNNYANDYTKYVAKSGSAEDLLKVLHSWKLADVPEAAG